MKVLIIENEKKIVDFIKKGLKEESYTVDAVYDGEEGKFMASTYKYDIIILDIMLPVIDGITLCKELRAEKNDIPIIMLTARDSVGDKILGLNSGADDYITKPFSFSELLARMRAILRRGRRVETDDALIIEGLELRPSTREVIREGEKIELTIKEYSLLEYMMKNKNRVLTRTNIMEHVWDYNFNTYTNIIDVHVNHLRNKIDGKFEKKLIHTIRGVGYIMKAE